MMMMMTGASGLLPERLCKDIIWNRVANLRGTGGNKGLDMVIEFLK